MIKTVVTVVNAVVITLVTFVVFKAQVVTIVEAHVNVV